MSQANNEESIKEYKQNYWRVYRIEGFEDFEFKGSEIAEMLQVNDACYRYMKKVNDALFDANGEPNEKVEQLSDEIIIAIVDRLKQNYKKVCSTLKQGGKRVATDATKFYYVKLYPMLFKHLKQNLENLKEYAESEPVAGDDEYEENDEPEEE